MAGAGMTELERERVETARAGRLATVRPDGTPHVVVVTYVLKGDTLVTAVDDKPKTTRDLQRLRNLRAHSAASLLVDHYEDDWSRLWWVRLDGTAEVVTDEPQRSELLEPLVAKHAQYRDAPPQGPVILLSLRSTTSWSATS